MSTTHNELSTLLAYHLQCADSIRSHARPAAERRERLAARPRRGGRVDCRQARREDGTRAMTTARPTRSRADEPTTPHAERLAEFGPPILA